MLLPAWLREVKESIAHSLVQARLLFTRCTKLVARIGETKSENLFLFGLEIKPNIHVGKGTALVISPFTIGSKKYLENPLNAGFAKQMRDAFITGQIKAVSIKGVNTTG